MDMMPQREICVLVQVSEVRRGFSGGVTYFIRWRGVANLRKFYNMLYFLTVPQDKLRICKRFTCTWGWYCLLLRPPFCAGAVPQRHCGFEIRSFPIRILRQADAAKSGFKIYCLATLITFLFLGKQPCLCRRKTGDQRKFTKFNTSLLKLVLNFVNVKIYNVNTKKALRVKV